MHYPIYDVPILMINKVHIDVKHFHLKLSKVLLHVNSGVPNHVFSILFVKTFNLLDEAFITDLHYGSHISLREFIVT